jgi:hypothetical protein
MTDSVTKPSSNGSKAAAAPAAAAATPPAATPAPGIAAIAAAEQADCYRSFGPAYLGTGIAGDLSLEIGVTTGSGEQQQRSGIGIYLRSDHVAHRYASQLLI